MQTSISWFDKAILCHHIWCISIELSFHRLNHRPSIEKSEEVEIATSWAHDFQRRFLSIYVERLLVKAPPFYTVFRSLTIYIRRMELSWIAVEYPCITTISKITLQSPAFLTSSLVYLIIAIYLKAFSDTNRLQREVDSNEMSIRSKCSGKFNFHVFLNVVLTIVVDFRNHENFHIVW